MPSREKKRRFERPLGLCVTQNAGDASQTVYETAAIHDSKTFAGAL